MCIGAPDVPPPIETAKAAESSIRRPQKQVLVDEGVNKRRTDTKNKRRRQAVAVKYGNNNAGTVQTSTASLSGGNINAT